MPYELETAIATAVSAAISGASVIIATWQLAIQRRHNQQGVTPRLAGEKESFQHSIFKWELVNRGVGPAVIKSFSFECEGARFDAPTTEAIEKQLSNHGYSDIVGSGDLSPGDFISPGEVFRLLEIPRENAAKVKNLLKNTKWTVTYKCIYGKEYTTELRV
ncbi:MAG: hypothetical protein AB3X41_05980 [Leptothrix ochracea]|uniref:hypothetical protein n=1 Tax=Leptothrix ochracea TaxID=735331 RepID=UPI0034E245A1